jgi:hypothetical protein
MVGARTLVTELPALGAGYLLSSFVHSRLALKARESARDFIAMLKIGLDERRSRNKH